MSLGGGIGGILYCKESGSFYYYHYDGSGNVTSVTDGDGVEVAIYEYDSFGNVLTEAGSLANEFRFSTKQADKRGQSLTRSAYAEMMKTCLWGSFFSRKDAKTPRRKESALFAFFAAWRETVPYGQPDRAGRISRPVD